MEPNRGAAVGDGPVVDRMCDSISSKPVESVRRLVVRCGIGRTRSPHQASGSNGVGCLDRPVGVGLCTGFVWGRTGPIDRNPWRADQPRVSHSHRARGESGRGSGRGGSELDRGRQAARGGLCPGRRSIERRTGISGVSVSGMDDSPATGIPTRQLVSGRGGAGRRTDGHTAPPCRRASDGDVGQSHGSRDFSMVSGDLSSAAGSGAAHLAVVLRSGAHHAPSRFHGTGRHTLGGESATCLDRASGPRISFREGALISARPVFPL